MSARAPSARAFSGTLDKAAKRSERSHDSIREEMRTARFGTSGYATPRAVLHGFHPDKAEGLGILGPENVAQAPTSCASDEDRSR